MTFAFQQPWALALLALVPLLVWLDARKGRGGLTFSSVKGTSEVPRSWRTSLLWLPRLFRALALVLLVIALARPLTGEDPVRNLTEGIAIAMVVDRSGSMDSTMSYEGERRSKLDVVKTVFSDFLVGNERELGGRPNDLVGVVAFAGEASTISPLTHSHEALVKLIEQSGFDSGSSKSGTAIGDAIALAAARLKTAEDQLQRLDSEGGGGFEINSKVMILLTDGEHNAGERTPGEGVALAQRWGIKMYAISFGNSSEGEALLNSISQSTGGIFREARDEAGLRSVYEEIDRLEKTEIESMHYLTRQEYFMPFLIAAFVLLVLELVLTQIVLRRLP